MITIYSIQRRIADEYGLTVADLREPAPRKWRGVNTYDKAHPRQTAIALSLLLTEHSLTRIGHFFGGRNRKTVYHAGKVVALRRRSDPKLHDTMRRITLELVRR